MSNATKVRASVAKHDEVRNGCGCITWWRGYGKAAKFYLAPCKPNCTEPNAEIARATGPGGIKHVRIVFVQGNLAAMRTWRR